MNFALAPDLPGQICSRDQTHFSPKLPSHRSCPPEETFARIEPLLAAAGITRIADVTGLDRIGIPVAMVARPNSRALSVSQGKGLDFTAAKVSGAIEALESFHAERIEIPVHLLRWSELAGTDHAVDPGRLPRLRNGLFHAEKRIPWVEAVDIVSGRECHVPLELVHTDFTLPALPGAGCFPRSSNGLASGNTLGEAAVHGLCEVIERDAYALYIDRPELGSRIMPASVRDPVVCSLVDRIESAGCQLVLCEITSDIGVPVFWARISGGGGSQVTCAPAGGLGCHPDRIWACVRAITEAAQSRLTRLSGSRDDLTRPRYATEDAVASPKEDHVDEIPLKSGPGYNGETVEDDLRWILARLAASGFDSILAVDLGRPDFGLPVLRVLVPGLEHPPSRDVAPGPRRLRQHA